MLSISITEAVALLDKIKKFIPVPSKVFNKSISQYGRSLRSEPIAMIDQDLRMLPELEDIMKTATSVYAAMYSQAFSIGINETIGDIKVLKHLDALNPDRRVIDSVATSAMAFAGIESHQLKLPDYSNKASFNKKPTISLEAPDPEVVKPVNTKVVHYEPVNRPKPSRASNHGDTDVIASFSSNLSTGLLFNVTVATDKRKVDFPIQVRLMANLIPSANIISLLSAASRNMTAKERWREWRAGGIEFWNDVVLCKDLLKEKRNNILKDKTGLFKEVASRATRNNSSGWLSLNPSISQISNIVVVSKRSIEEFETSTGKKLKDVRTRDVIFNNSQILMMIVVDDEYETATFYYHDVTVPTTATLRSLKSVNKKGGVDMMEIMRTMQMGNGIKF